MKMLKKIVQKITLPALIIGVLVATLATSSAQRSLTSAFSPRQDVEVKEFPITGVLSQVVQNTTSNVLAEVFYPSKLTNAMLCVEVSATNTGVASGSGTFYFDYGFDTRTNRLYSTDSPTRITALLNGTTNTVTMTNMIPQNSGGGWITLRKVSAASGTNTVFVKRVFIVYPKP